MKRATFFVFLLWIVVAPGLVLVAAHNLPPVAAVLTGAALGAASLVLGLWRAYRDSLI